MAVFGHCCSPWLGFQGGKGVATTLGVTLALAPTLAAGGLLLYVLVVFLFRVSGLGSLIAIGLMSIASWWSHGHGMGITLGAIYALVVWRHRSNIQALMARDTGEKVWLRTKRTALSRPSWSTERAWIWTFWVDPRALRLPSLLC